MMAVLVKRRVDTGTHHQNWLGGEDKIDTGHWMSMNVVGSLVISCSPNWEAKTSILEPSEVVVSPLYQLPDFNVEITNGDN